MQHFKVKEIDNGVWKVYARGLFRYHEVEKGTSYFKLVDALRSIYNQFGHVGVIVRTEELN